MTPRPAAGLSIVLLIGLLTIAGCGGAGGGSTVLQTRALSDTDLLQFGDLAYQKGDLAGAAEAYGTLLVQYPGSALASDAAVAQGVARGDLLVSTGSFEEARAAYGAGIGLGPASTRCGEARLAIGRAFAAQFQSLDGGAAGFVDPGATGEFLANLEAIQVFGAVAENAMLRAEIRLKARFELAEARFRNRQFPEARAEYARFIELTTQAAEIARAHNQSGLAFLQEGDAAGAEREFRAAGGTAQPQASAIAQTATQAQFGGFAGPSAGFLGLDDIVVTLKRTTPDAALAQDQSARGDLGIALSVAYLRRDLPAAARGFEDLAARRLPVPIGDLALLQLAEVRRLQGDLGRAVQGYQKLRAEYPHSSFAEHAQLRLGQLLQTVFSEEAEGNTAVDSALLINLVELLRGAIGRQAAPLRSTASDALNLLGNLDAAGIALPLTIAQPRGLPPGFVGVAYRERLETFGGQGGAEWSVSPATPLPEGLSLDADGLLSGTPSAERVGFVTLGVRDAAGDRDERTFPLAVLPFRVKTLPRLPDGIVGRPYSVVLEPEGMAPFTFEAAEVRRQRADGALETVRGFVPGLALQADGQLTGTPSEPSGTGPYLIVLRARDIRRREQACFFALFVTAASANRSPAARASEQLTARGPGLGRGEGPASVSAVGETSSPFAIASFPAFGQQAVLTPDGKSYVTISAILRNVLSVIDRSSRQRTEVLLAPPRGALLPINVAVSPDSATAVVAMFANSVGEAVLVNLREGTIQRRVQTGLRTRVVAFTPDGRRALARSANGLTSIDLRDGTTNTLLLDTIGPGDSLAPFPDSRRVLVAGGESSSLGAVIDLDSGSTTSFLLPARTLYAEVLPDGTRALLNEKGGDRLFVVDLGRLDVTSLFTGRGSADFAISRDGSRAVVAAVASAQLASVELAAGRVRRLALPFRPRDAESSGALAISPDGRYGMAFDLVDASNQSVLIDLGTLQTRSFPGFGGGGSPIHGNAGFDFSGTSVFVGRRPFSPEVVETNLLRLLGALGLKRSSALSGRVGVPFRHVLEPIGGRAPYRFEGQPGGGFPGGLVLDADGAISGTPSQRGLYLLEGSLADAAGTTAPVRIPLLIQDSFASVTPVTLVTRKLARAEAGFAFRATLAAAGGTPPYRFSAIAGLPEGLSLSGDGELSGRSAAPSTSTLTVEVADAAGGRAEQRLVLEIIRASPFLAALAFPLPAPPTALVALDLDRDGQDDLAVAFSSPTTPVALLRSGRQGALGQARAIAITDIGQPGSSGAGSVTGLVSGDFDGDGNRDLMARVFPGLGGGLPILSRPALVPLLNDGRGGVELRPAIALAVSLARDAVEDFDGDRKDDLFCGSFLPTFALPTRRNAFLIRAVGGGQFSLAQQGLTSSPVRTFRAVTAGDFDGDRRPDVAALLATEPGGVVRVEVFRGRGDGTIELERSSVVPMGLTTAALADPRIAAADLDRDGRLDLLVLAGDERLRFALASPGGGFADPQALALGRVAGGPLLADFTGEGLPDLLLPVPDLNQRGSLLLLVNRGKGGFEPPIRIEAGPAAAVLAAGDFDGDGIRDAAALDSRDRSVRLLRGRSRD